jgi:cell cycle checkpoint protein
MYTGKGDPPNPSASAKDIQREKDLDAALEDPPPLPPYMSDHERRTSRVDVDVRLLSSPKFSLLVVLIYLLTLDG